MIDREALFRGLNEGVLEERLHAFQYNLAKNLPLIARYGGLKRVVPSVRGKHVIIFAAGPSLDQSLPYLAFAAGRPDMVLVAVDMALRPLLMAGIVPHYVVSCETTPVDFFGGLDTSRIHLLAFSCIRHSTLMRWKGDVSFYNWMIDSPEYRDLWRMAGRDLGFVATGNSVTTQAAALVLGCGIRSLLLAGNDLAFRGRMYIRGAVSLRRAEHVCDRFNPLSGYEMFLSRRRREYELYRDGEKFYTDSQFLAAKLWLEDLFKQQDVPVYDCGVPGCGTNRVKHLSAGEYRLIISGMK